jgi:2'-5' RNA ligase
MSNLLRKFINYLVNESKDSKKESMMIALYPTKETISNIVLYRNKIKKENNISNIFELPENELHLTIRWWESKIGDHKKMLSDLSKVKIEKQFNADVLKPDILGDSFSLLLKSQEIDDLFETIDELVQSNNGPPSTYPKFISHLALFYGDSDDLESLHLPKENLDFKLTFDRIKMVDNDENIYLSKKIESTS